MSSSWNKRHRLKREREIRKKVLQPPKINVIRPDVQHIRVAFSSPYFTEEYFEKEEDLEKIVRGELLAKIAKAMNNYVRVQRRGVDQNQVYPAPIWEADVLVARVPEEVL